MQDPMKGQLVATDDLPLVLRGLPYTATEVPARPRGPQRGSLGGRGGWQDASRGRVRSEAPFIDRRLMRLVG